MTTSDAETDRDDGFDLLDAIREDPPRIRARDDFGAVARFRLGNLAYIHAVEELSNGRLVAYIGCVHPTDTSAAAWRDREFSHLNYAPVGALVAHPRDDDTYTVDLPDRDTLDAAIRARKRRENDHRATVLPALKHLLEDAVDDHAERVRETDDSFTAGVHAGMARMASLVHAELTRRWNAPYKGRNRWQKQNDPETQ